VEVNNFSSTGCILLKSTLLIALVFCCFLVLFDIDKPRIIDVSTHFLFNLSDVSICFDDANQSLSSLNMYLFIQVTVSQMVLDNAPTL